MRCIVCSEVLEPTRKKLCGSKECTKRANVFRIDFKLKGEEYTVNNMLSKRWEVLYRLVPQAIKDLMHEVERRLPLTLKMDKDEKE